MYGVWDQHHSFRILVAEALATRNNLLRNIALDLVQPMVLGLPVLLFLLWYSIRRGLDPLRALAREISRKRAEGLTPIELGTSPEEIRPMVLALNGLLQGVNRAMENERCFTANAAHELRTPLAAIQAHLAAARAASEPGERDQSLDQLQRGLERSIRLVGQLLTLARLDPEQALPDGEPLDIRELLESVCAEIAPLALGRDQVMELTVAGDLAPLTGNGSMLAMLFANIVDNAIRYTPNDGHIAINAYQRQSGLCVDVTDDGPGIPAAARERVFERFCRLADQSKPGTGLGLTICRRIAELHGASIELADGPAGRGLTVRLRFSAAGRRLSRHYFIEAELGGAELGFHQQRVAGARIVAVARDVVADDDAAHRADLDRSTDSQSALYCGVNQLADRRGGGFVAVPTEVRTAGHVRPGLMVLP